MNHAVSDLPTNNTNTAWSAATEDNILLDRTDSSDSDVDDKIETNDNQLSWRQCKWWRHSILERGTFATEVRGTPLSIEFS